VKWIVFSAVDLYFGLIIVSTMINSKTPSPERIRRLRIAEKIIVACLIAHAVALVVMWLRR